GTGAPHSGQTAGIVGLHSFTGSRPNATLTCRGRSRDVEPALAYRRPRSGAASGSASAARPDSANTAAPQTPQLPVATTAHPLRPSSAAPHAPHSSPKRRGLERSHHPIAATLANKAANTATRYATLSQPAASRSIHPARGTLATIAAKKTTSQTVPTQIS